MMTQLYGVLDRANNDEKEASILLLSRGTSVILLILYVTYLYFQLHTHANLFNPKAADTSSTADGDESPQSDADSHDEEYHMSVPAAITILVLVTVLVSVCADYLVDSIDEIVASGHISKNFIGLILIPIVGNAAEHVTACVVAVRNKMDLAMSVAIGSSIQIALLVTPFLVILGWAVLDQPMTLHFETFETVAFALSVLVVTYTVQDGKSNYLEGAMVRRSLRLMSHNPLDEYLLILLQLVGLYAIVALAFYVSPAGALDKVMGGLGSLKL